MATINLPYPVVPPQALVQLGAQRKFPPLSSTSQPNPSSTDCFWPEPHTRTQRARSPARLVFVVRRRHKVGMFLGLLESLPVIPPHTSVLAGWNPGELSVPPGHMAPENGFAVSPIRSLAPETLEEIIAFTPTESHLALCRVSKLLYALCIRSVYCDISLRSPAAVVKCCRTLAKNVLVASMVKRFEISYAPSALPPCSSFYSLIGNALQRMTNIHDLVLLVADSNYISVLARCSLPRLYHFECCLSLDDTMVSFLNRHLQIRYLQLGANESESEGAPQPTPRHQHQPVVTLPKLEYFIGNSSCVAPLIQRASLRAAFITWDAVGEPTEESIAALERSSTETLNVLSCRRHGWNIDLLDRISTHLPHIYALSLTNLFFMDVVPTHPANLQAIGQCLSRFSSLQRLAITCVNVWKPEEHPEPQMDNAFETVTAWGDVCPSLVECTVPQSNDIKWVRVCDNLWLPDPSQAGSTRWIWGMLRSHRYPEWDRVVDTIRAREGERSSGRDFHVRLVALRE
ncbi:F-box domain-containing protein [Mycena venus]|uniref:F-box domain-containing protein n=1 Tax=Mycena venus TaxID=2733690 RepID=A0A8H6Z387_9AGAR|nr:F-box domain-containing protein [Mycena venus]